MTRKIKMRGKKFNSNSRQYTWHNFSSNKNWLSNNKRSKCKQMQKLNRSQ